MRRAHKLFLLAALSLTALAMSATAASAQVEFLEESGGHCPTLIKVGHQVTGGCVVEYQSTGELVLFANIPGIGVTQLSNCEAHIEARVGEDGEGWMTKAVVTAHPAPSFPCTRTPCDEGEGAPNPHVEIPGQFHIRETAGTESAEVRFCLRASSNSEGVGGISCTVHAIGEDSGTHDLELGDPSTQSHCEPGDFPFDVWITNAHLTPEDDTHTNVELVH